MRVEDLVDRTAAAARSIASLAALPLHAAFGLLRIVTDTAAAVAQRVVEELRAPDPQPQRPDSGGEGASWRVAPVGPAARQPAAASPAPRLLRSTEAPNEDEQQRRASAARGSAAPGAEQNGHTGAVSPAVIRAWAASNGYEIGSRGRLSEEVRRAYAAAH